MGIHDETRFPNAFVRFRRQIGLIPTILWSVCSAFFVLLAVLDISKLGAKSPILGCVAGAALALLIRSVMFVKPIFTMHTLRAMWLVIMIYVFIVHRTLGAPTWSSWLMFGLAGFYLSATFVFYSSKFLYIAKLLETLPPQHANDGPPHEEDDQQEADGLIDQEVEEARRREAQR
jgi:hypothetical protein